MVYKTLAFLLGFTCFIVQLVMLREFMNLFMGNELVIGIILGIWMLLTAAGAWIGKIADGYHAKPLSVFTLLAVNGAGPLMGVFLALWLRSQLYAPGVMVSLQGSIVLVIIGLILFCLASGMMFTLLATSLSGTAGRKGIAQIYAIEALGGLAGGLLFNFIFIYALDSVQILILSLCINLFAATAYVLKQKKIILSALGILLLSLTLTGSFIFDAERMTVGMAYPGQEIIMSTDTPFGKLVAIQQAGQSDIYLSGQVMASSGDIINREEKVHFAMSLHDDPGKVLMLSGGLNGSPAEIIKYRPSVIDYVDNDPWSVEYADIMQISEWPEGINIYTGDPQSFMRASNDCYDVILYNGPVPNTIGNNRYFTQRFFREVKMHLNNGGIFSLGLPGTDNYISNEINMLLSSIHKTLRTEFEYIRIIPGGRTYFLASDTPLLGSITERIADAGILTDYVNQFYLDDDILDNRALLITEQLDEDANINTSTRPVAAHISILWWLGLQNIPVLPLIFIPLLMMVILLFSLKQYNLGLFATGFTASSGEFLLLIAFQAAYGFIYQMAGLIIMIFMAGLFAGAGFVFSFFRESKRSFVFLQAILGLLMLLIPLVMTFESNGWIAGLLIGVLTFILAVLTGIQYKLATLLKTGSIEKIASSTYGADLAGSAFGILVIGVFVFPVLGILNTAIILASINILAAIVLYLKKDPVYV